MSVPREAPQTLRLPRSLLARVEALQVRERISFSAAVRVALRLGLKALEALDEEEPGPPTAPEPAGQPQTNGHARRRVLSRGVPY